MTVDYVEQTIAILYQKIDIFFDYPCLQTAPPELEKIVKAILRHRKSLMRKQIYITFFGTFKAGKSTLINAILGERILPSRANRATGVITRVAYCPKKTAYITKKGSQKKFSQVPYDDVAKYILLDTSQGNSVIPENVESVVLGIPKPILKGDRVIIDTPGIRDTPELTNITIKELAKADLAVMVLKAGQILSEDEKSMALSVNSLLRGNVVFIINRFDEIDEEEESRADVFKWAVSDLQKLKLGNSIVGQPRVYATEAKKVLESRLKTTSKALNGITKFENWLDETLASPEVCKLLVTSRLGVIESLLKKFSIELEKSLSALRSKIQYVTDQERFAFERAKDIKKSSILDAQTKIVHHRSEILNLFNRLFEIEYKDLTLYARNSDPQYLRDKEQSIQSQLNMVASKLIDHVNLELNERLSEFILDTKITYEPIKIDFVMPPYDSTAAWIGASIGAVLGLPFGGFASVPAAQFGSYLGSLVSQDDYILKVTDSISASCKGFLSSFHSQHNTHFNRIEQEYSNLYRKIDTEQFQPSAFLRDLQETERKYIVLQIWHEQIYQAILDTKALFYSGSNLKRDKLPHRGFSSKSIW